MIYSINCSIAYIFENQPKLVLPDEVLVPCMIPNKNNISLFPGQEITHNKHPLIAIQGNFTAHPSPFTRLTKCDCANQKRLLSQPLQPTD